MNYTELLEQVKEEVTGFYESHQKPGFTYHNIEHTELVVEHAGELARYYQLSDREFFIVVTAAWFHDSGYYLGEAEGHEKKGAELAATFLQGKGVDEETIALVRDCIMATCMPQSPQGLLQEIVADADLYHWGTSEFSVYNRRMRKEAEWRHHKKISKTDWRAGTIRLLESHQFRTGFGREHLEPVKQQNIAIMKQKGEGLIEPKSSPSVFPTLSGTGAYANDKDEHQKDHVKGHHKKTDRNRKQNTDEKAVDLKDDKAVNGEAATDKKAKSDRPDRGIETMFRISSNNHQRLSDMADNKANIMITTTSIILSVLLSVLLRKLEDNPHLIIPTLILLLVCVTTMVFSILATRPSLPHGTFTEQNIDDKKVNLLFFGNFYRMPFSDYEHGMQQMMKDREFLYGSLTRDVYSQGVVLGRKYRLLRIAYNIFMFGVIVSVLAFITAVVIAGQK